jgi:hypothetical protein
LNISILAIFACLVGWTLGVDINESTIVGDNFVLAPNQLPFVWMYDGVKAVATCLRRHEIVRHRYRYKATAAATILPTTSL